MTQLHHSPRSRRGRVFPDFTIPPCELARREAEREIRYKKCRAIFDEVSSQLIKNHYNWFIVIEPNSGDYFVDINQENAIKNARHKYPTGKLAVFRLNETGACGRI